MPRKREYDVSALLEHLANNKEDIILDKTNGQIQPPSSDIWKTISQLMDFKISSKNIYTIVKSNRYKSKEKIGIVELVYQVESLNNEPGNFNIHSESNDSDESEDNLLSFNITLTAKDWTNIYQPTDQYYKRSDNKSHYRVYSVLKPNVWTPVIHTHLVEQTRLSCPIVYKRAKIYKDGNIFMDIIGHCSMCQSNLKGILNKKPESTDERVIIHFSYIGNFKCCLSKRKRHLSGEQKENVKRQLVEQGKSASYVQRELVNKLMNFGEREPAHLPSANALRVLKCKTIKQGLHNEDPIIALFIMNGISPFNQAIQDIGYDRFFLHYWTTTEIQIYRNYAKTSNTPTISIDATGGIVRRPTLMSGRITANIFLYEIGVIDHTNNCQFAVAHMLSERHDNNSIGYWLGEWKKFGIPPPKTIVADQSLALMMGIVKTFTQFATLNKYLEVCSLLVSKKTRDIPTCMLRNDFNHVMKLISSWFKHQTTARIKNFYLRSIGIVITSTDFKDIKKLLKYIFIVSLSETDGLNRNDEPTDCEVAKQYLKQRIATHTMIDDKIIDLEKIYDKSEEDILLMTEDEYETIGMNEDINLIYETCLQETKINGAIGDHDNMQYDPSIAKKLHSFCKLLPCWSAVMVPIFGYGNITENSATSESLFKDLKRVVFKHKSLPIRIDDFVSTHITSIIGNTV